MMAALRFSHDSIGLSADIPAVPVALLSGEGSWNLDVLQALLLTASDDARAAQLNKQRLDAETGIPVVRKALQQTAGLVKIGVKLVLK